MSGFACVLGIQNDLMVLEAYRLLSDRFIPETFNLFPTFLTLSFPQPWLNFHLPTEASNKSHFLLNLSDTYILPLKLY